MSLEVETLDLEVLGWEGYTWSTGLLRWRDYLDGQICEQYFKEVCLPWKEAEIFEFSSGKMGAKTKVPHLYFCSSHRKLIQAKNIELIQPVELPRYRPLQTSTDAFEDVPFVTLTHRLHVECSGPLRLASNRVSCQMDQGGRCVVVCTINVSGNIAAS